ncbi:MAG TPA: GAF domain-containing protein, partial [Polyangiaceae bacterium]|nr:GAF domain-containing protein [Polyangiaceae bacterium]
MPNLKLHWHGRRPHRKRAPAVEPLRPDFDRGVAGALLELSKALGSDWDASIRRIVKFDAELLCVERVNFWTLCESSASIHCDVGYVASLRSFEHGATLFESDIPEYFAALRTARMLDMHDVWTDPRCRGLRDYCASRGIASMLDVPVTVEGRLSGVLCHEYVGAPKRWSESEEELAVSIGQVVAFALSASAQTRVEGARRRAAFLDAFAHGLNSLDAREIGEQAVSMVVPGVSGAILWVLNRDGVVECLAFKHHDPEKHALIAEYFRPGGTPKPLSSSAVQRVIRQGQSLCIPDFGSPTTLQEYGFGPRERALIEKLAVRSVLVVPLTTGSRTFGAMTFAVEHDHVDAGALTLAQDIADRVASALENARLYEIAREAVRARDELLEIAAHELRTPLTSLQLRTAHQLRAAERRGDPEETARSEAMARDVRRFASVVDHMIEALNVRAQGITLAPSSCDLVRLVREAVARLAPRARAVGSSISLDGDPSVEGRWDAEQLRKVVDVLLDNAIK